MEAARLAAAFITGLGSTTLGTTEAIIMTGTSLSRRPKADHRSPLIRLRCRLEENGRLRRAIRSPGRPQYRHDRCPPSLQHPEFQLVDNLLMNSKTADFAASKKEVSAKQGLFEPLALLLLSLATIGTAWCSFQAAAWGGASQRLTNQSAASGRRAASAELQSYQLALLDVLLFSQYVNARAATNEPLSQFYVARFRGEAKKAFDAWITTKPFENTNAPAHPFVTNLYRPRLLEEAQAAEAESQRLWQQAGEAGRTGRGYVLITVLLASALFCGGTASKFERSWIRRAVLALGLAAFVFAAERLVLLPMQL